MQPETEMSGSRDRGHRKWQKLRVGRKQRVWEVESSEVLRTRESKYWSLGEFQNAQRYGNPQEQKVLIP